MAKPSVAKAVKAASKIDLRNVSGRLEDIATLFSCIKSSAYDLITSGNDLEEYRGVAMIAVAEKGHAELYKIVNELVVTSANA